MTRFSFAAMALVACGNPVPPDTKDGAKLFVAYCATCHGPDGRPPAAMVARMAVKDLTAPELRQRITVESVTRQILKGSENKLMPSFEGVLHEAQMTAIAQWVVSPGFVTPP